MATMTNGYSSHRAWETAQFFDTDEPTYRHIQRAINVALDITDSKARAVYLVTNYLCGLYRGTLIPHTRHPISKRSIREYVVTQIENRLT